MKTISDSDLAFLLRLIAIIREPLRHHPDRKVINAVRRATLLSEKLTRRYEKEKPKDTDTQPR